MKPVSSMHKCLPHSTLFKPECSGTATRGNGLHGVNDDSSHRWLCRSQKKAILLSSNSIRIIYLLKDRKECIEDQNHQPYLASSKIYGSCFQGQLRKPTAELTSVPFLVFQYFINVMSKVNLRGH